MSSAEVGTAHVSVYPQTDGKFGASVGNELQSGISAKSVAIGNIMSSALMRGIDIAVGFLADTFSAAFQNTADYEQLIGGVETMFKDSSDAVQGYAMEAYRTAGLSANQYMEQVTGFSASLIQSLDGDTEKAARDANMAIMDMSDNANKMGTDMASIQNAYQGFAKQNYTMLDNLKLGYGGTKSEMERLLADAEKISGVHYDIGNYDDVINAIHVMQVEMGIAGTTAEEASDTISGSLNSLSAAWQNWLTGLGTTDMDMTQLTEQLVQSIETAVSNVGPALLRIGQSIVRMIAEGFGASDSDITAAFEAIGQYAAVAVQWIQANVLPVVEKVWNAIKTAVGFIVQVFQAAWPIISMIIEQLSQYWQNLLTVVGVVADGISAALNRILPVVQNVIGFVTGAINTAKARVAEVASFITSRFSALLGTVRSIFNNIKNAIMTPINAAKNAVKSAIDAIKNIINGAHLQLPHFKLPHFNINGGELPWGIGGQGRPPSISVDWYARGGIVDGASLIGVGEAGPEAIMPLSGNYMAPFAQAIADEMDNGSEAMLLVSWLSANLGPIIENYAPTATPREFGRMVRSVV